MLNPALPSTPATGSLTMVSCTKPVRFMMTKTTYDAKNNCAQNTIAHNTVLKFNFQLNTLVSRTQYISK